MLFSHDWTISPECEQDGLWAGDNILFVPNQLLGKNHKICRRNAQLCTRSTVLALDTRSTVLKFQNNRASKFQKRCSQHPLPIFLEKWQNSSKVTEMNPFLSSTKAKKFFFHQSHAIPSKSLSPQPWCYSQVHKSNPVRQCDQVPKERCHQVPQQVQVIV